MVGQIGKTQVKYKGKIYKRWKTGYSPQDRQWQKETGNPKAFTCECRDESEWGKYHYLSCDLEQCPICKKQLLSCGHESLFKDKEILDSESQVNFLMNRRSK